MDHKQLKLLSVAPPLYPTQGDFTLDCFDRISIYGIIYVGKVAEVFTKYSLGRPIMVQVIRLRKYSLGRSIMFTDGFKLFLLLNPYDEECVWRTALFFMLFIMMKRGFRFVFHSYGDPSDQRDKIRYQWMPSCSMKLEMGNLN